MEFVASLVPILTISALAWLTPGPNMFAVIGASLEQGRPHGVAVAAGLTIATAVWVTFALTGATFVFVLFPQAATLLKLAGALYLIWLGFKSLRSAMTAEAPSQAIASAPRLLRRSVWTGFAVSITNPKSALFFGSIFAAFIPPASTVPTLIAFGLVCIAQTFVQHTITAYVFSGRAMANAFTRFRRAISALFGTAFLAMGAYVAFSELRRQ